MLQIGNKLRELGLIRSMKEITGRPLTVKRTWSEEEVARLVTLYHEYKVPVPTLLYARGCPDPDPVPKSEFIHRIRIYL